MSIDKQFCFVVTCDDCRQGFDEYDEQWIVHFDTFDAAVDYIAEHGWFINTDGHVRCNRCWTALMCDQFGHDWDFWSPCCCAGHTPGHLEHGCGLVRTCQRPHCNTIEDTTLADLPTIDEPTLPGR